MLYSDSLSRETIYLVVDSHATQWLTGFIDFSNRYSWKIRSMTKFQYQAAFVPMYRECVLWNDALIKEVARKKPNIAFISNLTNAVHPLEKNSGSYYFQHRIGFAKMIKLLGQFFPVSVIEDTPFPHFDIVKILKDPAKIGCNFSNESNSLTLFSQVITHKYQANWITTNTDLCDRNRYPTSIQGMILYRDHSHTSSFASIKLAQGFLRKVLKISSSHVPKKVSGPCRDRTDDPRIKSPLLCQLS